MVGSIEWPLDQVPETIAIFVVSRPPSTVHHPPSTTPVRQTRAGLTTHPKLALRRCTLILTWTAAMDLSGAGSEHV
jgi:hypothetical protein